MCLAGLGGRVHQQQQQRLLLQQRPRDYQINTAQCAGTLRQIQQSDGGVDALIALRLYCLPSLLESVAYLSET
jgi:hypothetical protein